MRHLYFRKGGNHAKVWAGEKIQGFHSFSKMEEMLQKGMPRRSKNEPKVVLRRPYFAFASIFWDLAGGRKVAIFKLLASSKVSSRWNKVHQDLRTRLTLSSSRYARGCRANGSCRNKIRLP